MRGGPRGFRPGFPCPAVLRNFRSEAVQFRLRGRYPLRRAVPCTSPTTQLCNSPTRRQTDQLKPYNPPTTTAAAYHIVEVWADPLSLATTQGVEVSFLSSGYLDVSVPQLASPCPMYSGTSTTALPVVGFPIRKSRGQRLVSTSPGLIAATHVLLRLLAPRHPPCALSLLIVKNSLYCCYGVFKVRAEIPAQHETPAHLERGGAGLSKLNSEAFAPRGRR